MALSKRARRRHAMAWVRRKIAAGKAKKADLERWADELGLTVEGTGSEGAITKEDLLRAFNGG